MANCMCLLVCTSLIVLRPSYISLSIIYPGKCFNIKLSNVCGTLTLHALKSVSEETSESSRSQEIPWSSVHMENPCMHGSRRPNVTAPCAILWGVCQVKRFCPETLCIHLTGLASVTNPPASTQTCSQWKAPTIFLNIAYRLSMQRCLIHVTYIATPQP